MDKQPNIVYERIKKAVADSNMTDGKLRRSQNINLSMFYKRIQDKDLSKSKARLMTFLKIAKDCNVPFRDLFEGL